MQLKAVLLSCLLAMQHCSASENQQNCLSVDQTLYQLNIDFQNELKTHFNLKRPLESADYKRYIEEISNRTISANFFLDGQKEKTVKSLKATPSFGLVWTKYSTVREKLKERQNDIQIEMPRASFEESQKDRKDFYVIDTKSEIFDCLIESVKDTEAKKMFQQIQEFGNLSPVILAESLLVLDKFEEPAIQIYIGLQFYYDFILTFNRLNNID